MHEVSNKGFESDRVAEDGEDVQENYALRGGQISTSLRAFVAYLLGEVWVCSQETPQVSNIGGCHL